MAYLAHARLHGILRALDVAQDGKECREVVVLLLDCLGSRLGVRVGEGLQGEHQDPASTSEYVLAMVSDSLLQTTSPLDGLR